MFPLIGKCALCCVNRCLAQFGIHPSPTYGVDGRLRFHSDNPVNLLDGNKEYAKYYYFSSEKVVIGNEQVSLRFDLTCIDDKITRTIAV